MYGIRERFLALALMGAAGDGMGVQMIAQMIASAASEFDRKDYHSFINEMFEQIDFLMQNETEIWDDLMPGPGGGDSTLNDLVSCFFLAEDLEDLQSRLTDQLAGTQQHSVKADDSRIDTPKWRNIVLEYPVKIYCEVEGDNAVLFANGCEFFMDEHGKQWVKFTPTNGRDAWKEHMFLTDSISHIVRDCV